MNKLDDEKKTVIFVMPRLPFPTTSGRKTSLYHYCKILSDELGYRLVVAAFLENGDDINLKPDFIDELIVLPKAGIFEKVFNVFFKSLILKICPIQVSLFWSRKAKKVIDRSVISYKPCVVIADMVRTIDYIKNIDCYRIADLDDRISLRYEREMKNNLDDINPYGAFLYTLPCFIRNMVMREKIKSFVMKNEIMLLKKYEKNVALQCDRTILVAQKEVESLNLEINAQKAVCVPIGVDIDYYVPCYDVNKNNIIAFLGAMNVAHNEGAVKYFIKEIMPKILKFVPDAKFVVIGGGGDESLFNLSDEHIFFTGRVDDVRETLAEAKVFVCPMSFGSGIKTKNLEAMAMGLPIVTTSIGAENIDAKNGEEWFVVDSDIDFVEKVVFLLNNSCVADEMGKKARRYVENNWTWKKARYSLEEAIMF